MNKFKCFKDNSEWESDKDLDNCPKCKDTVTWVDSDKEGLFLFQCEECKFEFKRESGGFAMCPKCEIVTTKLMDAPKTEGVLKVWRKEEITHLRTLPDPNRKGKFKTVAVTNKGNVIENHRFKEDPKGWKHTGYANKTSNYDPKTGSYDGLSRKAKSFKNRKDYQDL